MTMNIHKMKIELVIVGDGLKEPLGAGKIKPKPARKLEPTHIKEGHSNNHEISLN